MILISSSTSAQTDLNEPYLMFSVNHITGSSCNTTSCNNLHTLERAFSPAKSPAERKGTYD